jgi:hypothetical protein
MIQKPRLSIPGLTRRRFLRNTLAGMAGFATRYQGLSGLGCTSQCACSGPYEDLQLQQA